MRLKLNFLIFLALTAFSFSQSNLKIQRADSLAAEKNYKEAEQLYNEVLKEESNNNSLINKLASLYYQEKKYDDAIKNYLLLAPNKNPFLLYNLACCYSLINNKQEALNFLKEAVDNGFNQLSSMKKDPDLNNIRSEKKYEEISRSIKSLENFPEANKFDFWVGDWNVYDTQNQKRGDSKIEKILNGSVILENWTGINGYAGKSFNLFNMDKNKWTQYWVDMNSTSVYFEGNYDSSSNAIIFYSYDHAKDKSPYIRRLTFFNLSADSVRQFSQQSPDEGKTWTTEYDLMYVRKKS